MVQVYNQRTRVIDLLFKGRSRWKENQEVNYERYFNEAVA